MDKQEIFNKVWERAKIHVKSINPASDLCMYRNPNGNNNHCFVGVCIPDELYDPAIEEARVVNLLNPNVRYWYNSKITKLFEGIEPNFLGDLQRIHDHTPFIDWELNLKEIANKYNLSIPA